MSGKRDLNPRPSAWEARRQNLKRRRLPRGWRDRVDAATVLRSALLDRAARASNGCLIWLGTLDRYGYGRLSMGRASEYVAAHRLSWWLALGPIPLGAHVLHRCDRRACVEPAHLFLGDQAENMRDRDAKGRGVVPVRARGQWTGRMRSTGTRG